MEIIILLLAIIAGLSIFSFNNASFFERYSFQPYKVEKYQQYDRFISHIFLHGDWGHLLINGLVFLFFGPEIVRGFTQAFGIAIGQFLFFIFFLAAGVLATIQTYLRRKHTPNYSSVGASGAVSAVLFAFAALFPLDIIYLYGLFGLPAALWGVIYLGYSFYQDKFGMADYINHSAHLWGGVVGLVVGLGLRLLV